MLLSIIPFLVWSSGQSRGLRNRGVAGSRLARICEFALRRCARKRWVPGCDWEACKMMHNQYETSCGFGRIHENVYTLAAALTALL